MQKGNNRMTKKWWAIILFFIIVSSFPIYGYFYNIASQGEPQSSAGVLDLRNWNFESDGNVALNGEWEFYRNQLLTPEHFAETASSALKRPELTGLFPVPGEWNSYISESGHPEAAGFGTYRLRVELSSKDNETLYGIRTTNIRMANKVFLNGREAGGSGRPSASKEAGRPNNIPYVGFVSVEGNQVEVIVQVSNYIYESGGMIYPIWFGHEDDIRKSRELALFGDFLNVGGFSLFAVFFLLLFFMRKQERSLLYLALFCLSILVYVLTHGEKLVAIALPELNYEWILKLQSISATCAYYFLLHYVNVSVPHAVGKALWRGCNMITVAAIIAAILLPTMTYSEWFPLALAPSFFINAVLIYSLVKGVLHRSRDAFFLLLSAICILVYAMVNLMNVFGLLGSFFFLSFELLIFVIVQVVMLSRQFSHSFYKVEELSRRLLTLDGLKDEFMANTSHELRTPLHAIVNIAESLLEGVAGATNPDQSRQLSMIVSTGRRLNYLIHDILDFSTLRNGELVLNRQAIDLPATAQSVLEVIGHLADKKGISLTQEWPEHLPLLDTDEDRLRQILFNLLGNAVKFTHQGEIGISAKVRDQMVEISVRDTGIGMAWDRLSDIFEPYNSAAAMDLQGGYSGTGIGLSITKKLVELNGGQIGVQSEPGTGSVFYFTLPSASIIAANKAALIEEQGEELIQTAAQETAAVIVHGNVASPFTVLIIDDDPVNLQVLINLLSIDHYSVIAVDNGADALEVLAGMRRIDLVITDWTMPEMSGLELCRLIRKRFALSELPVLMLTARNFEGDIGVGFSAGVNDFLTKPVDSAVLRVRVRTLLELRQSVQAAIRSQMAFLQAQIKPHFLYNAMNTIISICHTDPEKASELLMDLSYYLRSNFDFQNREQVVSLEKELELVQAYTAIEQARFGERLRVIFEIDKPLKGFIPPLSIQPIVENAVRHGVMKKAAGGTIVLSIRYKGAKLIISISDDGVGMKQSETSTLLQSHDQRKRTGVGLINIHRRLLSLYGAGLSISSKNEEGTTITFEVPQLQKASL